MKDLNVPVLFLVFNRPDKTLRVFNVIREARPRKLYVAIDAPREGREDDIIKCNQVKEIVQNVDWPCESHYLVQEKNLGCTLSGKTAWDWLFSNEDKMIFIEDDGLATSSFFYYCQDLLLRYENDDRIAFIGGVNYLVKHGEASYFFSHLSVPTYGMATWKRTYNLYEYELDSWPQVRNSKEFRSHFVNRFERDWFISSYNQYYDSVKKGVKENTYDKQMSYLVWKYNKFCIHPNLNLVSNIGFDEEASNTKVDKNSSIAVFFSRPAEIINDIIHPGHVDTTKDLERKMFKAKVLLRENYLKAWLFFYCYLNYKRFIKPFFQRRAR